MLKTERIRLHFGQMPAKMRFSYGEATSATFACVELFANGLTGTGECIASQDRHSCIALAEGLLGKDALKLDQLIQRPTDFDWRVSIYREMFSMALHDLVGQHTGQPLYAMLGARARERIPHMPCIFAGTADEARQIAQQFMDEGYQSLKMKIYAKPQEDLNFIQAVRSVFKEGFLQADANLGYQDRQEALELLPQWHDAGLSAIEDPAMVSLEEYSDLMAVSRRPRIILDSNTRGDTALNDAVRLRCCDAVNLHPNMQGTFSEICHRAAAVHDAGIDVEIGGTGYTGVGANAYQHIAGMFGESYPYGEIGGYRDHGFADCTASQPLPIQNGTSQLPDSPGHGGRLDLKALARHCQVVELQATERNV